MLRMSRAAKASRTRGGEQPHGAPLPERQSRPVVSGPAGTGAGTDLKSASCYLSPTDNASIDDERLARFKTDLIADATAEASGKYWARRSAAMLAARPRPGDFTGRATPEELEAQDRRLLAKARACSQRAAVERGWP